MLKTPNHHSLAPLAPVTIKRALRAMVLQTMATVRIQLLLGPALQTLVTIKLVRLRKLGLQITGLLLLLNLPLPTQEIIRPVLLHELGYLKQAITKLNLQKILLVRRMVIQMVIRVVDRLESRMVDRVETPAGAVSGTRTPGRIGLHRLDLFLAEVWYILSETFLSFFFFNFICI